MGGGQAGVHWVSPVASHSPPGELPKPGCILEAGLVQDAQLFCNMQWTNAAAADTPFHKQTHVNIFESII